MIRAFSNHLSDKCRLPKVRFGANGGGLGVSHGPQAIVFQAFLVDL
jgi:hypothetical protein